jgi:hypothetical protein
LLRFARNDAKRQLEQSLGKIRQVLADFSILGTEQKIFITFASSIL